MIERKERNRGERDGSVDSREQERRRRRIISIEAGTQKRGAGSDHQKGRRFLQHIIAESGRIQDEGRRKNSFLACITKPVVVEQVHGRKSSRLSFFFYSRQAFFLLVLANLASPPTLSSDDYSCVRHKIGQGKKATSPHQQVSERDSSEGRETKKNLPHPVSITGEGIDDPDDGGGNEKSNQNEHIQRRSI